MPRSGLEHFIAAGHGGKRSPQRMGSLGGALDELGADDALGGGTSGVALEGADASASAELSLGGLDAADAALAPFGGVAASTVTELEAVAGPGDGTEGLLPSQPQASTQTTDRTRNGCTGGAYPFRHFQWAPR